MIDKNDLLEWLKQIDRQLKTRILLIAAGGTAMTLLGLKESTIDVDFCIESKNLKAFKEIADNSKFKVDLFKDGFVFSEQLPDDYIIESQKIAADLKNIDLRALSLEDIIITKAARYNERDEEDIEAIAKTNKVKRKELEERFRQVKKTFVGREEDYNYHFELILKRHFENNL